MFRKAQNSVDVLKRELVSKFERIVTKKYPVYGNLKFFFQAEDGIRDRSPSRGLGDVYKRQQISRG